MTILPKLDEAQKANIIKSINIELEVLRRLFSDESRDFLFKMNEELFQKKGNFYYTPVVVEKSEEYYWESSHDSDHYGMRETAPTKEVELQDKKDIRLVNVEQVTHLDPTGKEKVSFGNLGTWLPTLSQSNVFNPNNIYPIAHLEGLDDYTYNKYIRAIEMSKTSKISATRVEEIRKYEEAYRKWVSPNFDRWVQPALSKKYIKTVEEWETYSEEGQDDIIEKVSSELFGLTLEDFSDDWIAENERGRIKVELGNNFSFTMTIEGDVQLGSMGLRRLGLKEVA